VGKGGTFLKYPIYIKIPRVSKNKGPGGDHFNKKFLPNKYPNFGEIFKIPQKGFQKPNTRAFSKVETGTPFNRRG